MRKPSRIRFLAFLAASSVLVASCLISLIHDGDLSFGRRPFENLRKTAVQMAWPSFLDVWYGDPHLEYRSDDGTVLRIEDRRVVERSFLSGLVRATWTTIKIGTLGSLLGALLAFPLGLLTARNLNAPQPLALGAKVILDCSRSIHTVVFGLFFVGIVGLGPTAGILAIACHSLGTYGKLYAEAIESLDMAAIDGVRSVGADPMQVFFLAVLPAVLPQFISTNLYVWEYNIRDSTILGLIGAGGIGLLVSEAISLFQWHRLTTLLLVIVGMVILFDTLSRRLRQQLL